MNTRMLTGMLVGAGLVLVAWALWSQLQRPGAAPTAPIAAPRLASTPIPSPAPRSPEPTGHRLAGVAVGDQGSFAVFEGPDGQTELYRPGDDVPGLGKLVRVAEGQAVIEGEGGEVEFRVRPAATPTADLRSPSPSPPRTSPTTPPRPAARTAGESPP